MSATVASLHRFPVKSMLGERVQRCHVAVDGVVGDRAWAVLDAEDGTVASAKHPRKWAGLLGMRAAFVEEPVPGGDTPPVRITFPDGTVLRSDEPGTDDALSAALGRPVLLSSEPTRDWSLDELWPDLDGLAPAEFIDATSKGRTDEGRPVSRLPLGEATPYATFFDLAVLHLLTTSTLARLAELAPGSDFDVRRYRPNLVLDVPGEGFTEDDWVGGEVRAGEATVAVTMRTMRCVMTTLAQEELPADPDTLRTIAAHHRREAMGGLWACAGVYAGVAGPGEVRVGDPVVVPAR